MEKKYIKLSLIIIFIISVIILFSKVLGAEQIEYDYDLEAGLGGLKARGAIGEKCNIANADMLRGRDDVYCIEHRGDIMSGIFTILDIMEFDGKKVTINKGSQTIERTSNENATMAYLFCKGNYSQWMYLNSPQKNDQDNYMSARNIAIWAFQDTWLGKFNNGDLNQNWKHGEDYDFSTQVSDALEKAGNLKSEAISYGKKDKDVSMEITGSKKVYERKNYSSDGNTINVYGPFKVKFSGDYASISVYDAKGTGITNQVEFYTDLDCTAENKKNNLKEIGSDNNFYIKVKNNRLGKVTCKASSDVIKGKAFFLANQKFWPKAGQALVIVDLKEEEEKSSVDFQISGELCIYKKDDVTESDLEGAYFKIYKKSGIQEGDPTGWLSGYSNYLYKTSMNQGTEYRMKTAKEGDSHADTDFVQYTTINGKRVLKIKGLSAGEYRIYEVKTPDGAYRLKDQKGYDNQLVINGVVNERANVFEFKIPSEENENVWAIEKTIYNTEQKGEIIISKADKDTKEALEGAEFIVHKDGNGWLKTYNKTTGKYEYSENCGDAVKFSMSGNNNLNVANYDSNKKELTIKELENGIYNIYETKAPDGYKLNAQSGYKIENGIELVDISADVSENKNIEISSEEKTKTVTIKVYNERDGELIISKQDFDTKDLLEGAEFIIKKDGKEWIASNSYPYEYTNDYNSAAKFALSKENNSNYVVYDSNKKTLTIKGLKKGTYQIYETKAPSGYNLARQSGYNETYKYVDTGVTIRLPDSNNNWVQTTTITNTKLVSVSGFVWIDKTLGKNGDSNGVYDPSPSPNVKGEEKVANVKVRLINKTNGKAVITNSNGDDFVNTDSNGSYLFDNLINKSEVDQYYIEFDYSNLDLKKEYTDVTTNETKQYINYIPVKMDTTKGEGSKALLDNVPKEDINIPGIASTYKGTDEVNKYGIAALGDFDINSLTYKNINLGLKKLEEPKYSVDETVAYIKIIMKGYTYTYNFDGTEGKNNVIAPKVKLQNGAAVSGFKASVYPSDIVYNIKNKTEALKVYVVYKIGVENLANYGTTEDTKEKMKDLYIEKKLNITSLKNTYDSNRYTLERVFNLDNKDNVKKEFDNWSNPVNSGEGQQTTSYNLEKLQNGVLPEERITTFIEFRVNEGAIEEILTNPYDNLEKIPTKVEAIGYHDYMRNDYSWANNIYKAETKENHITQDYIEDGAAPYLIFKLGEDRTITGKVFKDNSTEERSKKGEVVGNGIYDDGESAIENVKVELIDAGDKSIVEMTNKELEELPVSNLYRVGKEDGHEGEPITIKADNVYTNSNGEYTLAGIVPGDYLLRFTYGNGKYKYTDTYGNSIEINTSAKDYKSTILTNEITKKAFDLENNKNDSQIVQEDEYVTEIGEDGEVIGKKQNYIWYRNIGQVKDYSVALDNLDNRRAVYIENGKDNISAGTPKLSVTIENTKENTVQVNQNQNPNKPDEIIEVEDLIWPSQNKIERLNFGIIEQPIQRINLDKIITNISFVNGQGNISFNGNPETDNLDGVMDLDLDPNNGGSKRLKAELAEENISEYNLGLTYTIKVTNSSDVNYYNDAYYLYGEADDKYEVTLNVNKLMDYLDENLIYNAKETNNPDITESKDNKKTVLLLKDKIGVLYTNKNTNRKEGENIGFSTEIVAYDFLSKDESNNSDYNDREYINEVEITEVSNGKDIDDKREDENAIKKDLQKIRPIEANPKAQALAIITPPTGADKEITIYVISAIIALSILATGIIIIKKKI